MRNPNKRRSKLLGVVILCLSLVASGLIGAGIAKYISSITGSSSANVAIWSVEINDQQIASPDARTFTFQLFDTLCEEDCITPELHVSEGVIAPGTGGRFTLKVENLSQVDAELTLVLTEDNEKGIPIQYSTDLSTWNDDLTFLGNLFTDFFLERETGAISQTVYWRWCFRGGDDAHAEQTSKTDTNLGVLMQNQEVAVVIGVELTVNQYFPRLDPPDASLLSVAEITESSVTLQAIDGAEYSMDNETWQGSTVFEDLNPGEEYTFYVRYKETYVASASTSVSFKQKTKNPVTGITVTAAPDKTVYIVGDAFDNTGMVITATYLNGDTQIIESEAYILSDHTDLALGQSTVTVTYTEEEVTKTVNVPITVVAEEFTITYMVDGGAFTDGTTQNSVVYSNRDRSVVSGEYKEPVHEMLSFINWYTDPSCAKGYEFDFTSAVADTTVYAKFDYKDFVITISNRAQVGYVEGMTNLVIPETFLGDDGVWYRVVGIGSDAFSGRKSLQSVSIPNTVTNIDNYAFAGCSALTSMTIPDSVTSIGKAVFSRCTAMKSVTIGNGVTSIGTQAFYWCDGLEKLYISDVRAWCQIDFADPESNPFFEYVDVYLNGVLLTDLVVPEGTTHIGQYAFKYCFNLKSVSIPESVTHIGYDAFYDCDNLRSVTINGSGETILDDYAFGSCVYLSTVTMEGVSEIGMRAFYNCDNLSTVSMGSSLRKIGNEAFYDCAVLRKITIPASTIHIGSMAFCYCTNLSQATFENPNGWWVSDDPNATSGKSVYLGTAATAADNLNGSYKEKYWNRSD